MISRNNDDGLLHIINDNSGDTVGDSDDVESAVTSVIAENLSDSAHFTYNGRGRVYRSKMV